MLLNRLHLIGEVLLSSSMVSNSLASWANSSSGSGSSRSLTELDRDGDLGVLAGVRSPATSVVVKVLVSPDFMPTSASSRPSISWPDPTSWDSPSVLASGTSSPSTVADRSIETKSPSSTARSTPVRVPNRARSDCSSLSMSSSLTSIGSTVTLRALRSGSVISGRMSTSAVNTSSWPSSILVISISG